MRLYTPSPHAGHIMFHDRVVGVKASRPEREYFILLAADTVTEPISITGWKVFDKDERVSYKIPKGVRVVGTSGLQKAIPIKIEAGDTIIVSSGRSPIGNSFLVNKCSGYRSQFKNFTPSIKTECPDPLDEFIANGNVPYSDNQCYDIANRLRTCTAVTNIPSGVTNQCRDFLEDCLLYTSPSPRD